MDLPEFRARVESHLRKTGEAPSRLSRRAMGDPAWIFRFLDGFEPKEATRTKVLDAIKSYKPKEKTSGKAKKHRK